MWAARGEARGHHRRRRGAARGQTGRKPRPPGFSLRQEGAATVVGRETCVTAEKLWLWREMEWPEIKAEPTPRTRNGARSGAGGGLRHGRRRRGSWRSIWLPGCRGWPSGCFLVGLVTGGWDAAVDTWANLKKREIDIHFLMLAVAIGAVFIGAWGEAVLLLFLFSASGAMEEYALDRTQREVSALLKASPKRATVLRPTAASRKSPSRSCSSASACW
jgi:Cd2+/Zn2+-exporting ATPase